MRRDPVTGLEAVHARFHGHAYDMHVHDDEWLVGVTHSGLQDFYCRGRRLQSTAGRVILIEPGERHDGQAVEPQGFTYSMLYLPADWLHDELGGDGAIGFRDTLTEDPQLARALWNTCTAIFDTAPRLVVEAQRDAVLDCLRSHLGIAAIPRGSSMDGLASRAMEFLEVHFADEIGIADLVAATGATSRFQLSRAFRTQFGTSPHSCLVQMRLAAARRHLRKRMAPAEVAQRCGFADQSHMNRWFRRAYGMTPGAYARGRTNVQDLG
jgi:AraC-like DNA-binding protein